MYISIHVDALGSLIGAFLILIFASYSLIYIQAYKSDKAILDFFSMQVALFIFLIGYTIYSSSSLPSQVLMWTKICYFGTTAAMAVSYRFYESLRDKKHGKFCLIIEILFLILSLLIFIPGDHFFTDSLNPLKTHSSMSKGDYFLFFVLTLLLTISYTVVRTSIYILSDIKRRKESSLIIIGLSILFICFAFDGIFAATLSITRPQMWIGPTSMAFCLALFTVKIAKNRHDEVEKIKIEKEQIYHNLIHDKISGLFTRDYLVESLNQTISQFRRKKRVYCLLYIDLDNFKLLNDDLGHKIGDEVLNLIGGILKEKTRMYDVPARIGGDEFLILLGDCNASCGKIVAKNIQDLFSSALKKKLTDWNNVNRISMSIGVLSSEDWVEDSKQTIHKADLAMYASKNSGKNRITIYTNDLEEKE